MLYPASGGTLDWTLGEAGIPYRFAKYKKNTGLPMHYGKVVTLGIKSIIK